MELLISYFIAIIFLLGVPIIISYSIYQYIRKMKFRKFYRLLALIPLFIVTYLIYEAIYPNANFYKTDFREVTNMEFPENGKILYKTASFPDQFGDYTSSFLVELDDEYIKKLEVNLKNNNFIKKENGMSSEELDYIEKRKGSIKYSVEYIKDGGIGTYYSVGILNDKKSVIITRVSW